MASPIVFIHQGAGSGINPLNYALLQARWWNPQTPIIVIADQGCRESLIVPGVELVELERFVEAGEKIRLCYAHHSFNSQGYELFCMERWFVLGEFMKSRGMDRVFYLDSDVMLYTDLRCVEARFEGFDVALPTWMHFFSEAGVITSIPGGSLHSTLITLRALNQLIATILSTYVGVGHEERLASLIRKEQFLNPQHGISDMTFVGELVTHPTLRVGNLRTCDPPVFDENINFPVAFRGNETGKIVEFDEANQPYGYLQDGGQQCRLASLHFQGEAKRRMPDFLRPPSGSLPNWTADFISSFAATTTDASNLQVSVASDKKKLGGDLKSLKKHVKLHAKKMVGALERVSKSRWLKLGRSLRITQSQRELNKALEAARKLMDS